MHQDFPVIFSKKLAEEAFQGETGTPFILTPMPVQAFDWQFLTGYLQCLLLCESKLTWLLLSQLICIYLDVNCKVNFFTKAIVAKMNQTQL